MEVPQFYSSTEKYLGCFVGFHLLIMNPASRNIHVQVFFNVNLFLFLWGNTQEWVGLCAICMFNFVRNN